jgi:Ca2+-binding EF-hand superfamily protein
MHKHMFVEEERLQLAFKKLDVSGQGYLTRESIKLALGQDHCENSSLLEALMSMDVEGTSSDSMERKIDNVFAELDFNHDGEG